MNRVVRELGAPAPNAAPSTSLGSYIGVETGECTLFPGALKYVRALPVWLFYGADGKRPDDCAAAEVEAETVPLTAGDRQRVCTDATSDRSLWEEQFGVGEVRSAAWCAAIVWYASGGVGGECCRRGVVNPSMRGRCFDRYASRPAAAGVLGAPAEVPDEGSVVARALWVLKRLRRRTLPFLHGARARDTREGGPYEAFAATASFISGLQMLDEAGVSRLLPLQRMALCPASPLDGIHFQIRPGLCVTTNTCYCADVAGGGVEPREQGEVSVASAASAAEEGASGA